MDTKRWIMLCVIPCIAILVAARQLYLNRTDDLSTWKGGGMGMFAAADNFTRYAKIYLLLPDGRRQPLQRLTTPQITLVRQGLWFPRESHFRALVNSIKATRWWASTERVPLNLFDEFGQMVRNGNERYHDLYPAPQRTPSETLNWGVEVEYWKATYDVKTGDLTARLERTFTFKD